MFDCWLWIRLIHSHSHAAVAVKTPAAYSMRGNSHNNYLWIISETCFLLLFWFNYNLLKINPFWPSGLRFVLTLPPHPNLIVGAVRSVDGCTASCSLAGRRRCLCAATHCLRALIGGVVWGRLRRVECCWSRGLFREERWLCCFPWTAASICLCARSQLCGRNLRSDCLKLPPTSVKLVSVYRFTQEAYQCCCKAHWLCFSRVTCRELRYQLWHVASIVQMVHWRGYTGHFEAPTVCVCIFQVHEIVLSLLFSLSLSSCWDQTLAGIESLEVKQGQLLSFMIHDPATRLGQTKSKELLFSTIWFLLLCQLKWSCFCCQIETNMRKTSTCWKILNFKYFSKIFLGSLPVFQISGHVI